MNVLCTFKIRIESQNSDHRYIKNPVTSQEPPVSSKAPNEDLTDMDVFCTFKIDRQPKFRSLVYKRPSTIFYSRSRCQTPVRNIQHPPKPQMRTLRTWIFFAPSKSRKRAKIWIMGISKSSVYIQ